MGPVSDPGTEVLQTLNLKVGRAHQRRFCMQAAMECAKEMGCKASIVDFVMPLGTTVNMNGTALYEATTVIFLAQVCVSNLQTTHMGDISAQASPLAGVSCKSVALAP